MMRTLILALLPVAVASARADVMGPPPRIIRTALPSDAQVWALEDAKTIPAADIRYVRWIWIHNGEKEAAKLAALTVNYPSRGRIPRRPLAVAKGNLLRIDLRSFIDLDNDADLAEWLVLWEDFRFDPSFATIITKDALQAAVNAGIRPGVLEVGRQKMLIRSEPYTVDGQQHTTRWVDALALPGVHLDAKVNGELQQLTGSRAPVVEDRYFTFRMLSTIKDKGVYAEVFGGKYYDFEGLSANGKGTALARLFERLGIGDVDKNLTAETVFARAKSEQRVAMFRSRVTGKPRLIAFFPTLSTRFGDGQGWIAITFDIGDADVDIGNHAVMNLLKFKFKAMEVIYRKPNGLHGFALFDANGNLQDEAPPDVVADHLIPSPHTKRLAGAISCIRCHGFDGSDGLKPAPNDVQAFRQKYKDAPGIFGDIEEKRDPFAVALDKLAGLYAGDHNPGIATARRDYIKAILTVTGPYKEAADDAQVSIGKLTANQYKKLWEDYYYSPVTPRTALLELGYDVGEGDAVKLLRELLKPPQAGGAVVLEDARIAALLLNVEGGITRTDWSLVYSFAANRARANEKKKP